MHGSEIVRSLALLLPLCASGCTFLDELDRSIERKAAELTKGVTEPAPQLAEPAPPPAREPMPEAEPAPAPPLGTSTLTLGTIDIRGALLVKDARRIIERHQNELRFCYEQTLAGDSSIALKLVVSPTGAVQTASVVRSDSGLEKLDECLAFAVRRWTFPAPKGGGIAVVTMDLTLARSADGAR